MAAACRLTLTYPTPIGGGSHGRQLVVLSYRQSETAFWLSVRKGRLDSSVISLVERALALTPYFSGVPHLALTGHFLYTRHLSTGGVGQDRRHSYIVPHRDEDSTHTALLWVG